MNDTLDCLPIPTGPYQVGIAKYDLLDQLRNRLIPIQIYFPMAKGNHILQQKLFEQRALDTWPPLQTYVYGQLASLSELSADEQHPIIFLNHGESVAMTDYAFLAEDLTSHGYVVIAMQHQLNTDPKEPPYLRQRSVRRYSTVIDNLLFTFEWLKSHQLALFHNSLDLKKVGLIGHSMGGNALLLLANRTTSTFKKKEQETLLPHHDMQGVKEALIVMDTRGFAYPAHNQYPLFFLMAKEWQAYQEQSGVYQGLLNIGHKVKYYKGSKHISFMDHGYINPLNPENPESYFNGTLEERKAFFNTIRSDIREFLHHTGIKPA